MMIAHTSSAAMATAAPVGRSCKLTCVMRTSVRNTRSAPRRGALQVVAGKGNLDEDSYQKVEDPVRDSAPDQG
jgi:hypothetical protein